MFYRGRNCQALALDVEPDGDPVVRPGLSNVGFVKAFVVGFYLRMNDLLRFPYHYLRLHERKAFVRWSIRTSQQEPRNPSSALAVHSHSSVRRCRFVWIESSFPDPVRSPLLILAS